MGGLINCLIDRLTLIKSFSRGRGGAVVTTGVAGFEYPAQRYKSVGFFGFLHPQDRVITILGQLLRRVFWVN